VSPSIGVVYLLPAVTCQLCQRRAYEDPGERITVPLDELEIFDLVRTSKDAPTLGSKGGLLVLLVHQVMQQMRPEHLFLQNIQPSPS
jgi:hypothetical protein